jgi:hypothetical protein
MPAIVRPALKKRQFHFGRTVIIHFMKLVSEKKHSTLSAAFLTLFFYFCFFFRANEYDTKEIRILPFKDEGDFYEKQSFYSWVASA